MMKVIEIKYFVFFDNYLMLNNYFKVNIVSIIYR